MLFPSLVDPPPAVRVEVAGDAVDLAGLAARARAVAEQLTPGTRVAVLAERRLDTLVAVVGALAAGAVVIPVNPTATEPELAHVAADADVDAVALAPGQVLPESFAGARAVATDRLPSAPGAWRELPVDDAPALVMYTSGTTGPPKGAVLSRAAVAANLDALAAAWDWRADDVLVHALPLYHVHGLVLGLLLPVRRGTGVVHLGAFDAAATAAALHAGGTVHFGVPTIYRRLVDAAEDDPAVVDALAGARLLVSGSAGLPVGVHRRITDLTGAVVVERYGMTETMITTAVPAGRRDQVGTVGPALPGVELRVVDDDGGDVPADGEAMGEILVRTPSLFTGYRNQAVATEAAFRDGWFVTGDVATIDGDGCVRIVGRRSSDLIKSGGYRIGAGEVEDALADHPAVAEVAVAGVPDEDLGQRVTAWVVARPGTTVDADDLRAHAAARLAPHKRPRAVVVVDALPRNHLGKVLKRNLPAPG